jgi:hypothetical protein
LKPFSKAAGAHKYPQQKSATDLLSHLKKVASFVTCGSHKHVISWLIAVDKLFVPSSIKDYKSAWNNFAQFGDFRRVIWNLWFCAPNLFSRISKISREELEQEHVMSYFTEKESFNYKNTHNFLIMKINLSSGAGVKALAAGVAFVLQFRGSIEGNRQSLQILWKRFQKSFEWRPPRAFHFCRTFAQIGTQVCKLCKKDIQSHPVLTRFFCDIKEIRRNLTHAGNLTN